MQKTKRTSGRCLLLWFISIVVMLINVSQGEQTKNATISPPAKQIKAGFIYVGPVGDYGWTHAHDVARRQMEKKFPWLKTIYVESVAEGDCARVIDRLVQEEKCDVVFTTSFGFMDATLAAGEKYPDKIFMHCSGYKRAKNVGTYFAELYQMYYLNGLMAGALTKTNKIGYVGAHPIPEVVRHINAFALGIKEVNPKAKVYVKWLFSWYEPAKAREAAETLIAEGCDALAITEDSIATIEVGQSHTARGKQIFTFSHYSPMQKFGPDSVVSGQLVDWSILYEDILIRIYTGVWRADDWWWLAKEKAALLGGEPGQPINPKFIPALKEVSVEDKLLGKISVYDLVMKRLEQMSEPTILFDPFTGPIEDQQGKLRLKAGERASHDMLWKMDWFVPNVEGSIPK